MTDKRRIKNEIERLKENTDDSDVTVWSSVTTVTHAMTDEDGRDIVDKIPDPELPDGYERGRELHVDSPVVDIHTLTKRDD
jgi:hypothetical protein